MADNEERPAKLRRLSNGEKIDTTIRAEAGLGEVQPHKAATEDASPRPAPGSEATVKTIGDGTRTENTPVSATGLPATASLDSRPEVARDESNSNGTGIDGSPAAAPTQSISSSTGPDTASLKPDLDTTTNGGVLSSEPQGAVAATASLTATPGVAPVPTTQDGKPLSKNAQKKLRKKAEWEAGREDRKLIRKEKTTARRERKKEAKRALAENPPPPSADPAKPASATDPSSQTSAAINKSRHHRPVQLPITFLIDCNFDELMTDSERISLGSQVTRCYSDNRTAPFRAHLAIASFHGKLRERFEGLLKGVYKSWKGTKFLEEGFVEVAEQAKGWMSAEGQEGGLLKGAFAGLNTAQGPEEGKEALKQQGEIVYLSSEADEVLTELKPYSTYIIGGLVDKNREKGICHRRAKKAGVKTMRLPIGKYLEMQSRKVLTTNHVNEIMVRWLECRDWGEAFMRVIPKRKGGRLRGEKAEGKDGEGEEAGVGDDDGVGDEVAEDEGEAVEAVTREEPAAEVDGEVEARAGAATGQLAEAALEADDGTGESDIDIAF